METGTYRGDMINAVKDDFDLIYSIELSPELYEAAQERFAKFEHIQLIQGDSGIELANVLLKLDRPSLFWLDGHYSGGVTARGDEVTPILQELDHIFTSPDLGHVIIIDDARLFVRHPRYPDLKTLQKFIVSKNKAVDILIKDDSIRITPSKKE